MKKENSWMMNLTPEQLHVIRDHGTEAPGSSPLNYEWREGVYQCIACHAPLFKANTKFESGCGWPSFFSVINGAIETEVDTSHHMKRIEVHCANVRHIWVICFRMDLRQMGKGIVSTGLHSILKDK